MEDNLRKKAMDEIKSYHDHVQLLFISVSNEDEDIFKKVGLSVVYKVGDNKIMYGEIDK